MSSCAHACPHPYSGAGAFTSVHTRVRVLTCVVGARLCSRRVMVELVTRAAFIICCAAAVRVLDRAEESELGDAMRDWGPMEDTRTSLAPRAAWPRVPFCAPAMSSSCCPAARLSATRPAAQDPRGCQKASTFTWSLVRVAPGGFSMAAVRLWRRQQDQQRQGSGGCKRGEGEHQAELMTRATPR